MTIEKTEDLISIEYRALRSARFSAWNFDDPWLLPGETATIFGWWVADGKNPLYKVRRDKDGDEKAIHQSKLLEYGTIATTQQQSPIAHHDRALLYPVK